MASPGVRQWHEQLVALDLLTLVPLAQAHGQDISAEQLGQQWAQRLSAWPPSGVGDDSALLTVSAAERLLAYAWLRLEASGEASGEAFVLGLVIHPEARSAGVVRGLMRQLAQCLDAWDVPAVSSHVYRLNEASMRFHRKLGFQAVQENAQAVAFTLRRPVVGGWMARLA